jgi:hypothetical protein
LNGYSAAHSTEGAAYTEAGAPAAHSTEGAAYTEELRVVEMSKIEK